jgi:hypothetical protein
MVRRYIFLFFSHKNLELMTFTTTIYFLSILSPYTLSIWLQCTKWNHKIKIDCICDTIYVPTKICVVIYKIYFSHLFQVPPALDFFVTWLALSNSFWNPFLYWLLNAHFRSMCKDTLSSRVGNFIKSWDNKIMFWMWRFYKD